MQQEKKVSKLRRPFVIGGAAIGVILCGWYLFNNFGRVTTVPDPIWTRFVNLAVIMFLCIYLANLLRVAVELFLRRR
ncbi:hypothetical protein [Citrifermentans bremense]|uniref:hypothetical protein n=1 Tax=Citrifermentans bremense TaxID=60035 RepID=UPI0003F6D5E6|nr:hypothetical protein [Citrifermentans bremense]